MDFSFLGGWRKEYFRDPANLGSDEVPLFLGSFHLALLQGMASKT